MWMMPLQLHDNQKSDYDYDDMKINAYTKFERNWLANELVIVSTSIKGSRMPFIMPNPFVNLIVRLIL